MFKLLQHTTCGVNLRITFSHLCYCNTIGILIVLQLLLFLNHSFKMKGYEGEKLSTAENLTRDLCAITICLCLQK